MRATTRIILLGLVGASAFAWIPPASAASGDVQARIENFAFAPDPIKVPVGASVTWTNNDSTTHTVTADDGSFDSGHKGPDATFTEAFPTAGTISYHCNIHSGMTGTIVVGDAGGSAPTTTTTVAAPTTTTTARLTTTTAAPTTTTIAPETTTAPRPTTTTAKPATTTSRPKASAPTSAPIGSESGARGGPAGAEPPLGLEAPTTGTSPTTQAPAPERSDTQAAEATPSTEVASGVVTPARNRGGSNGATAVLAAAAALLLGAAATGAIRYRRRRSTP